MTPTPTPDLAGVYGTGATSVGAGNIIVIKTLSGSANAAAEAIDNLRWPEVVGTLAGDNTIFVAVKDVPDIEGVMRRFHEMLH